MSENLVLRHDHGRVRLLTLNDPERRNPLSDALADALEAELAAAERDPEVRAVVLTGAGKAFSAGADLAFLKRVRAETAEANLAHSQRLADLFLRVYTFPKPTLAAVNGPAVAGGAGLATACDLVVMDEAARIGYTEVKIGFVAALVGVLLVRAVGEKHARELLLGGDLVDAATAYRMGLVNRVAAAGESVDEALAWAARLAENAPSSLALTKQLLASFYGMGLEDALRYAAAAGAWIRQSEDLREGLDAFFEKRRPRF
ncbi:enoyl-CoA hydratase/isomerase family protein [Oceanithermus profundus]|uniref:Enoyl-CoA hydratase/isomerase n=1 Tax=Oceanithermus profundus (strain DSM 14977 / NBRC 100410 / VKM B-2274 / 506) TaxID=670487 RepID=E4U535_OCEP5|nr:enoyl-CoA hydratase-related protein [Oceanithermus profundus]ADR37447.1 Enoyl-CoA hydratase/isomerase [Oceanithermus profundus DSM 14977]